MAYVIGVDVGGTNTDAVVLAGSTVIASAKRPTSQDKTSGVMDAIRAALESLSEQKRAEVVDNTARVSIGTTHFVNAVLERDRDRLSRVVVIRLCGSASRALPPFADFPADLHEIVYGGAYMVSGGLEYTGEPIAPISEEELKGCVQEILKLNPPVRNLVISGVFSPRDDPLEGQEVQAARIVKGACPDISCTLSHGLGLLGLLERENACILNEAIKPLAKVTIAAFHQALDQLGLKCPFYLTQNDGTLINAEEATLYPVLTFSSGPTNSMRGAAFLSGLQNAIVVDIGGTTTDVGVLRGGFPREASSQLEVGGVRTNFCMPDVKSIALGGGSFVQWDDRKSCVQVGPTSVGYRLTSEALCFGGKQCTATDVSIASGVAPADICGSEKCWATVSRLGPNRVYAAMRSMRLMLEAAIDSMKVEKEDIPVLLVGGGSILVDLSVPLRGASRVVVPEHFWNVANAVGAALGTVGGTSDSIMNLVEIQAELKSQGVEEGAELERQSREEALERGRENAKSKTISKGAVPATVYIHTEDVSDVAYVSHRVRVKVKAIGSLAEPQPTVEQIPDRDREGGHSDNGEEKPPPPFTDQDNPHWPNCSAEDRARDEATGLPPPRIQDKEWVLSSHDVECLALGAGILGCGGGGDPNIGRVMAQQVLAEGKEIRIVNPCRVDATRTGLLTSVAFMGAPAIQDEKLASGNETVLALRTLQQALACGVCRGEGEEGGIAVASRTLPSGAQAWVPDCEALSRIDVGPNADIPLERKVTTLLCSEVGGMNSIEPLLVSAQTGLPVIDADGMGRAFPELQMFLPFIYGSRPYPSCVADNKGEVICCSHIGGAKELEEFFRVECVRMGMSAGVAIGVLTLPEVMERCVLFSMSQAWQLGRAVLGARRAHNNVIDTIISQQHGTLMITGKVLSVIREVKGGFLTVVVVVEGLDTFAGHQVKLQAKNEYYIVRYMESGGGGGRMVEGPVLACTPDLITVIDSDLGFPITTEGIRYGMRVGVLALPANPRWKTDRALKVVGPTAFGFKDVEYAPPSTAFMDVRGTNTNAVVLAGSTIIWDKPHWPNCSAEDRARDEATGLPPPQIQETNVLPGTDIAGETQVIIESNKKLHFDWKNYGLKLNIPEDALPHKLDQCTLTIKALTSGQFKLPPDCTLISAVYQIEAHVSQFARPLTLEIQHCSPMEKHDSSSFSFVIADTSTEELPYQFKVLQGGLFSPDYTYGSISLNHFSFISIIRRIRELFSPRSIPLRYCAQLYRICQCNTTVWGLHFVITKDLESEITVVRQKLEAVYSNMKVDGRFPIEFKNDEITLSIPEGLKIEGWNISCQHHPSITKVEVDRFQHRAGSVPGCLLLIHWTRQHQPVYFEYKVLLNGAKCPRNYFTIVYPPLQTADVAQSTTAPPIYRTPSRPMESGRETLQYKRVFNTRDLIISALADSVSIETLAGKLRINRLIGDDIHREARGAERTTSKISHIIDIVLSKVELNPANYDKFIDILREFGDLGDLIEHIERAA